MALKNQVNATIDEELMARIDAIETRRGVKPGTLGRMALQFYVPLYEAGQANPDHIEFLAQVAAAVDEAPEIKAALEAFMRTHLRRAARPARSAA